MRREGALDRIPLRHGAVMDRQLGTELLAIRRRAMRPPAVSEGKAAERRPVIRARPHLPASCNQLDYR